MGAFAAPAFAQETPEPPAETTNEIVITAQGRAQQLADVPLADYLRRAVPGVEIVGVAGLRNYSGMAEVVGGADVLVGLCTAEIVARGTNLKWIQLLNAGADSTLAAAVATEQRQAQALNRLLRGEGE